MTPKNWTSFMDLTWVGTYCSKKPYVMIKCSLLYSQLPASTVLLTLSGGTDTEQIQKSKEMHFCNHLCPRELDSCLDLSSVTDQLRCKVNAPFFSKVYSFLLLVLHYQKIQGKINQRFLQLDTQALKQLSNIVLVVLSSMPGRLTPVSICHL